LIPLNATIDTIKR